MKEHEPYFDAESQAQIDQAIEDSQASTRAHIVPVVVHSSGRYDRAEDVVGLLLGLVIAVTVFICTPDATTGNGSWAGLTPLAKFIYAMIGLILGFIGGAVLATHVWPIRRLFTAEREMKQEVNAAARVAFHDLATRFSDDSAGLLIYVSVYEHRAVILADDTVLQAIGQPVLNRSCQALTDTLKSSGPIDAILQAISQTTNELANSLPASDQTEAPQS